MPLLHRQISLFSVILFAIAVCTISMAAPPPPSPENIPGTVKINAEQLIELVTETSDIKIIDSRIPSDREHGFIEGSVNLADIDTTCETLADIIPNYSSPVIFYCNGPECGRSAVAAQQALNCHYKMIYWFRGGYEEWLSKNYPVIEK